MKIKWLGHSSFLITSGQGTRILTDPYKPGFRGMISYGPINESADIITISHEHGDHNDVASVGGNPEVIRGAGSFSAKGINFHGLATFHDKSEGKERGINTIFTFILDNMRICHLGDLGHSLNKSQLKEIGRVDVLMVPVGGPAATLDLPEVEDLCKRLIPKVILPMHFKSEKCAFPRYSVSDFLSGEAV